ncbi:MAG: hypothetical protein U0930_18310 [Pirellulales bacterium]
MNRILIFLVFALFSGTVAAQNRLDDAISRATKILQSGVKNYPEHRSCFSCHHQALPLLANSVGSLHSPDAQRQFYQQSETKEIVDFTSRSFISKIETLNSGAEIGGRALTVAYGLWTFDLAGEDSNATTQAMVENLLKTQDESGAWNFQSLRPPAASSRLMTSAVAVYGLRSYGSGSEPEKLQTAFRRAYDFSLSQTPGHHEDLIGQAWLESMILEEQGRGVQVDAPQKGSSQSAIGNFSNDELQNGRMRLEQLGQKILQSQKVDGGWSQTSEMSSDAYATGQALVMLSHLSGFGPALKLDSAFEAGAKFLMDTQKADGSWFVASRSKPVQVFFDNGDPHGKDQFISMMATGWATAALREAKFRTNHPLTSPRVERRLRLTSTQ